MTFNNINWLVIALIFIAGGFIANSFSKGKTVRKLKKEIRENKSFIIELNEELLNVEDILKDSKDSLLVKEALLNNQILINKEQKIIYNNSLKSIKRDLYKLNKQYQNERKELVSKLDSVLIFENGTR